MQQTKLLAISLTVLAIILGVLMVYTVEIYERYIHTQTIQNVNRTATTYDRYVYITDITETESGYNIHADIIDNTILGYTHVRFTIAADTPVSNQSALVNAQNTIVGFSDTITLTPHDVQPGMNGFTRLRLQSDGSMKATTLTIYNTQPL